MSTASMRIAAEHAKRGFTLLELLVALVLTGVVALLVYGSTEAAFGTQTKLDQATRSLQAARVMRATLEEALRSARPSSRRGEPAFALDDRRDARGQPVDRLRFVTIGGLAPLTPGEEWTVTVEPTPAGLQLVAVPNGVRGARSRVIGPLPRVTGLDVRVPRQTPGSGWAEQWPGGAAVPSAVELRFWSSAGPVGMPLRIAIPLGGGLVR